MRCLNCHHDGIPPKTEYCPNCRAHLPNLLRDVLPSGTLLDRKYEIDYALGQGSFGITYRAHHAMLEQTVALKEYYLRPSWVISLSLPLYYYQPGFQPMYRL